jgi:folate-binding protein YgfZ
MNPDWQDFLQRQHALLEGGVVLNFNDAAGELAATVDGTVLCDMSQFGTLRVSGEDAPTFLQNMLSSDVAAVTERQAQPSSFNTAKGRMLATFLIWKEGGDYFLHLPTSLRAPIQKKMSMYVLRSKVKIEDVSGERVSIGLAGENAADLLRENVSETLPQGILAVEQVSFQGAQISVIRAGTRFQINLRAADAPLLWQKLCAGARPVGSPCWDWLNIRAGVPLILPATQEQFVPQMANLDLIGGVSFKKGCYPGQEIVARMHYLGKLKQRMYLAHVGSSAPVAGDKLYSAEMAEQSCGTVVNAAPAPGGGYDLLAVVQIAAASAQRIHLGALEGALLEFMPLPYSVPAEGAAS